MCWKYCIPTLNCLFTIWSQEELSWYSFYINNDIESIYDPFGIYMTIRNIFVWYIFHMHTSNSEFRVGVSWLDMGCILPGYDLGFFRVFFFLLLWPEQHKVFLSLALKVFFGEVHFECGHQKKSLRGWHVGCSIGT